MKKILSIVVLIMVLIVECNAICDSERKYENGEKIVYCVANKLNGRTKPNTNSDVEMRVEYGFDISLTGRTYGYWYEAYGGESGTVWYHGDYISETFEDYKVKNSSDGRVWVRKSPSVDSKKVGTVKKDRIVTVKRTIDGWGYIGTGWINLEYFEEVED